MSNKSDPSLASLKSDQLLELKITFNGDLPLYTEPLGALGTKEPTMDHCDTNSVNYDTIYSQHALSSRRLMKSHHLIHNNKTWALNQDAFPQLKSYKKGNVVVFVGSGRKPSVCCI